MSERVSRTPTATSNFGAGRREGHDASAFYARFTPPEISTDDTVNFWTPPNPFVCGDASAAMRDIPDSCVALVVTSPPYFVGKEYEEALGQGHVPATYLDYLDMLYRVFKECKRVLEPGGRIAVNVANLGRKPYRSLSADVIGILQDQLGFLLRGEVIWRKGEGASGSCAWGSFGQVTNPVLRDLTERVVVASKGRFDRALSAQERQARGLPHEGMVESLDEFMEATLDVWDIAAESARRVGHPAPFPVELPQRLIELYTFKDDLVLDPFMGVGSALVAAARTGRRYMGYDLDATYVRRARARVEAALARRASQPADVAPLVGRTAKKLAEETLSACGFNIVGRDVLLKSLGHEVRFVAEDRKGRPWYFPAAGVFRTPRPGLLRPEALWKALSCALALTGCGRRPVVLLTTDLPRPGSAGDFALRAARWTTVFDAIEISSAAGLERLRRYAAGEHYDKPLPGFWNIDELAVQTSF